MGVAQASKAKTAKPAARPPAPPPPTPPVDAGPFASVESILRDRTARRRLFLQVLLVLIAANGIAGLLGLFLGFGALGKTALVSLNLILVCLAALSLGRLVPSVALGWLAWVGLAACLVEAVTVFAVVWVELQGDTSGRIVWTCVHIVLLGLLASFLRQRQATSTTRKMSAVALVCGGLLTAVLILADWSIVTLDGLTSTLAGAFAIIVVTMAAMTAVVARMANGTAAP